MIREFSAGGVVIRNLRGRPHVAVVRVGGGGGAGREEPHFAVVRVREPALPLPKGHPEKGESSQDAALREVREETGLEATPVEKLGDIKYWYARDGDRVMKIVSFFLFRYRSGRLEDHDHEVEEALWIPLEEASERLAYKSEKEIAQTALSRVARGS
jgi:8-oxo-dGTP pyrophosphatase MutT (NUDIX family)